MMMSISGQCFRGIKGFLLICRNRPIDALAFVFIVFGAISTYIYGTFEILPILLADCNWISRLLGFLIPTWIVIAILSNLLLIKIRDSSIRNKMLVEPVVRPPSNMDSSNHHGFAHNSDDHALKARTKYLGEQFMPRPFGEDEPWHICAACEIFVPPRTWHCSACNTCILRRDHHCIFAMGCIGEENHCNFLGLLLYLALGTSISTLVNVVYTLYWTDTVLWVYIVKSFVPMYVLIFDFNMMHILSGINWIGCFSSAGIFAFYIHFALRGQTSADSSRGISRVPAGSKRYSFQHMEGLLGPNSVLKILWPFHKFRTEFTVRGKGL